MTDGYAIGRVAELAHVSVRTLHHYDEVGLVRPSARTAAGHRRYTATDLQRLREVLFYRELDFGLEDIASMLANPGGSTDEHLRRQHRLLRERRDRDDRLLAALEKEMEARQMGISLSPEEQLEVFGSDKFAGDGEYAREAEQRWGDTEAWRQSQARAAAFTKQDWVELKAAGDRLEADFAAAMSAGVRADGDEARALAERHRSAMLFDCGYAMHRNMGQMFVDDPRFAKHYDDIAPGLAQYVRDTIVANAEAHGA